jgi:hypothetical protein
VQIAEKRNYLIFVLPENIVLVGRDCSWIITTGCVTSGAGTAYVNYEEK